MMEFELDPLDINLAKCQMSLIKKLPGKISIIIENDAWDWHNFEESFDLNDPTRQIGRVRIAGETDEKGAKLLVLTMWAKGEENHPVVYTIVKDIPRIVEFVKGKGFLKTIKTFVLGYNEIKEHGLEKWIRDMVSELWEKVEWDVPEEGDFKMVYVKIKNPDRSMSVTDWMLRIDQPPEGVEGRERIRCVTLVGYKLPSPYICEKLIEAGTKREILDYLDGEKVIKRILELIPIFDKSLSC